MSVLSQITDTSQQVYAIKFFFMQVSLHSVFQDGLIQIENIQKSFPKCNLILFFKFENAR